MLLVAEPVLGEAEKSALSEVIDRGWITMGDRVREFEQTFARLHGVDDCVAVNSCTAALHLILQGLGIGQGDEVLVPSMTFVATINCVLYVGATPVFVDVESLQTPLMSIDDAAAKCTPKTKAVIVMHYAGYLSDRETWRNFAEERGLFLIEDSAHAVGTEGAGTYGDAAAFSFYGNKNMTTAEGGIVIARDKELLRTIRQLRGHGMTSGTLERLTSRSPTYDVTMLGYNYRMDELRAAVGIIQLQKLQAWNEKRKFLSDLYKAILPDVCPTVTVPFRGWNASSSHHIMPIVLPREHDRQSVISHLKDANIQTTIHYPPAHRLSLYQNLFPSVKLEKTEEFSQRELTLPLHPMMGEDDVSRVVAALGRALAH